MTSMEYAIRKNIIPAKNIILEGCDNVGKSYIAKEIAKVYKNKGYKILHFGRDTDNSFKNFSSIIKDDNCYIIDRFHMGQMVYQTKEERKYLGWMTNQEYYRLEEIMRANDTVVVYVYLDPEVSHYLCKMDSNDSYYDRDRVNEIMAKYDAVINMSTMDVVMFKNPYKVDISKIETDRIGDIDFSKLPEIWAVDFDCCLFKTNFPDIISPNTEFINKCKEAKRNGVKLILWTTRTDGHLDEAIRICKSCGLTFDAINDNVREVKRLGLSPRKVYANRYYDDKGVTEIAK